ncbi:MAG: VWA domain-containing protein [Paramuribaculum sp.]|nr:VWA domain-containing protein [Paramuribaculum sp.]
MQFAHPNYLWLLLILIPYIVWYVYHHKKDYAAIGLSTTRAFGKMIPSYKVFLLHAMYAIRILLLATLIIIFARPQQHDKWSTVRTEGTDIVLALDISSSMLSRDFSPNRFEAAKKVASQFVAGRQNDNIGLVIFAGESLTGVPMTTDNAILTNYINSVNMNMLKDGTAVGDGLATSINRIKEGKAVSKSIILLTDGSNNAGVVDPLTAAEIAKKYGIKVYTIGVGTNGTAPYPTQNAYGGITYTNLPVVIDEATLRTIAQTTGGQYFRATDETVLAQVFKEIEALQKSEMDVRNFSHTEDDYLLFGFIAFGFLIFELLLRNTILRTLP